MKTKSLKQIFAAGTLAMLGAQANAAVITDILGNNAPGFVDGDTPGLLDIIAAQSGQPAPFNSGIGHELLGPDFDASWTHNFGAIADTIVSATFSLGIFDHDSASAGDQIALFTMDGVDFIGTLNGLFEGSGGANNEYNVYSFVLPGTFFANLADGAVSAQLTLQGPVETPSIFPNDPPAINNFNAAHLIFSQFVITTQTTTPPGPTVPEPGSLLLMAAGLLGLGLRRRNRI